MADRERFLARVHKTEGCWEWIGARDKDGYGFWQLDGKKMPAHRAAYILFIGPVPDNHVVDHVKARGCTKRHCVRPDHLEAVTVRENVLRSSVASPDVCRNGHARTPDNTYTKRGRRECLICRRENDRLRRHKVIYLG